MKAELDGAAEAPPASERVSCEHAALCAGCPLIELTYAEQLEAKRERVKGAAAPYPDLSRLRVEPVAPAEPFTGYRIRAKLMVGPPGQGANVPSIGLFARAEKGKGDHRVVDIPGCRVLAPSLQLLASKLRELLEVAPREAGPCLVAEGSGGLLSAWDLREVDDERTGVLVTLVLGSGRRPLESELAAAAAAVRELSPDVVGVAVNLREARAVQVLGPTTRPIWGSSAARDRVGSAYRLATFGSFTQVHRGQATRIEQWIASRLGAGVNRVLDLYGGSGALSLGLAKRGAKVTLVESFRPATECAERAAREQGIDGFTVRSGDAARVLAELSTNAARFDAVITNPPRKGMPPVVRAGIASLEPVLIAYVSCDPETLCRDLDHFSRLGYRARDLLPVDMIPLTDQVETVAFLERAARPPPVVVYEDDDLFIIERFAYDPPRRAGNSRGHLGDAPVALEPARRASGLAVGCKAKAGDASLRAALAHPGAQYTYLALCRGIVPRSGVVEHRTGYRRLARAAGHSVALVTVRGGNTTRIERDLGRIGHPIIGDARHGHAPSNRHFEEKYALDRPFLHCLKVEFDHPRTQSRVAFGGTLPGELTMVLDRLGLVGLDVVKQVMVG